MRFSLLVRVPATAYLHRQHIEQDHHQRQGTKEMAAIDTPRVRLAPAGHGRIGRLLASLQAAFIAWNDARVTRNALSSLSDRELEDIGLSRGDIDRISGIH